MTITKKRTLIIDAARLIGKKIRVSGWVNSRRDHGKLIFIDLRDRSGILQIILKPSAISATKQLKAEWIISVEGRIKERPKGTENIEVKTGKIEMVAENLEIISENKTKLPIDISKKELKLRLTTLLDNRALTLRHKESRAIFRVYQTVLQSYRAQMQKLGFIEIKTPKILGTTSEGGANLFSFDYFGKKAFLAQSPQLYKQIGVGAFERVFEVGPVFRREPHFTTRHLNEYISLDAEIGFISDFEEIMNELEKVIKFILETIWKKNQEELKIFNIQIPQINKKIPRVKLNDIKKIIKDKYGHKIPKDADIDPKGEELAGRYAKAKWNSDLLFLTHYPVKARPFYTMPLDENPEETKSFDLLFRGIEIATGGQRIHCLDKLVKNMKKIGLNPKGFKFYLQAFECGMPPHGGWGMGCERIVYKILNLSTVKKAFLFPRDVKRLTP